MRYFTTILIVSATLFLQNAESPLWEINSDNPITTPTGWAPMSGTTVLDTTVMFVWGRSEKGATYEIILADNRDFLDAVSFSTRDTTLTIPIKDSVGTKYWKVRACLGNKFSDWSPAYLFYPRKQAKYEIKAPCGRIGGCAGCPFPCGRRPNMDIKPGVKDS